MNPEELHDEIHDRLRRLDPVMDAPVDPVTGPRAAALMEQIMQTQPEPVNVTSTPPTPARRPRRALFAALGALGVAAVGAFAFVAMRGDDAEPTSVAFSLAASDPLTQMCLPISDQQPSAEASAFRGTVVDISADSVTLDVTKWYQNGDADQVVISTAGMPIAALDGVDFVQGGDYLITAGDGQVGVCGVSGPYSADLEGWFTTWYG